MGILSRLWPRAASRTKRLGGSETYVYGLGAVPTIAGEKINEIRALNLSAVYDAVDIYASALRTTPANLYRRTRAGLKEIRDTHTVHDLLHRQPNPEMGAGRFRWWMESQRQLWGNAYAEIERDRSGTAVALWPIHPSRVTVTRAPDGRVIYTVYNGVGVKPTPLESYEVFHLMAFSHDGLVGLSPISVARESMGLTVATERHGQRFFGNNAMNHVVIKRPAHLKPLTPEATQNLRIAWMQHYSGDNAWAPALVQEGMDIQTLSIPNDDSQFLGTREFQIVEIARWFHLQPHKLKHLGDAKWANIEQQQLSFLTDSLAPRLAEWGEEATLKLLSIEEQRNHFVKLDPRAWMWADHAARSAYYETMTRIGVYSINDVLALEDMNTIGEAGDLHLVDMNKQPIEKYLEEPEPEPEAPPMFGAGDGDTDEETEADESADDTEPDEGPPMEAATLRPIIEDAVCRVLTKEAKALQRARAKFTDPTEFRAWARAFVVQQSAYMAAALAPIVEASARGRNAGVSTETERRLRGLCHDTQSRRLALWLAGSAGGIVEDTHAITDELVPALRHLWDKEHVDEYPHSGN